LFRAEATYAANTLYASTLADAQAEVAVLRKRVLAGEAVDGLGDAADKLLAGAAEKFAAGSPAAADDVAAVYEAKAADLAAALTNSLEPVYVQQLALLKDAAIEQFKKGLSVDAPPSEAQAKAEATFAAKAAKCAPSGTGWGCAAERDSLASVMTAIGAQAKKAADKERSATKQLNTAMSYLQMQQQQMQALQAQFGGGGGGKWNLGAAWRPPDTNINFSGSYQQGRTNLQIAFVPDEGAPLLGANGFTNGVGPANLGLSFNVNL
jgi:hypothetical protein